jgi:hypothetical protein
MQPKPLKMRGLRPRAALITAGALCALIPAIPALSSAIDTLVITENSDTSLSVTWNGGAITPTLVANDHWQITLPALVSLGESLETAGFPSGAAIPEPGAGSLGPWNNVDTTVTVADPFVSLVDVQSDDSTTSPYNISLADGVSTAVGATSTGTQIYLTFHDVGDGSVGNVPDQASTAVLASISFLSLFGAARLLRRIQPS